VPTISSNDPTAEQERRPYYSKFPYFGNILQYSNVGWSNYDAMQLSLVARSSHASLLHFGRRPYHADR
jgi:hypothetical protein